MPPGAPSSPSTIEEAGTSAEVIPLGNTPAGLPFAVPAAWVIHDRIQSSSAPWAVGLALYQSSHGTGATARPFSGMSTLWAGLMPI